MPASVNAMLPGVLPHSSPDVMLAAAVLLQARHEAVVLDGLYPQPNVAAAIQAEARLFCFDGADEWRQAREEWCDLAGVEPAAFSAAVRRACERHAAETPVRRRTSPRLPPFTRAPPPMHDPIDTATLGDRLLRMDEVEAKVSRGKSSIYRMIQLGTFPEPLQVSAGSVRWRLSDIDRWIAALPVGKLPVSRGVHIARRSAGAGAPSPSVDPLPTAEPSEQPRTAPRRGRPSSPHR